jgi:2-polyprenyl-3-methyl-5-hydroxy-6-metoxy-1,4-benzoquinol methylase
MELNNQYDAVVSLEVVEHVDMPLSFLTACSHCVKNGGSLIISTMNRTSKSFLITKLGAEYLLNIIPIGKLNFVIVRKVLDCGT